MTTQTFPASIGAALFSMLFVALTGCAAGRHLEQVRDDSGERVTVGKKEKSLA